MCVNSLRHAACNVQSSVASPALQYLSALSDKRHSYRKTVIESKTRVLIFFTAVFWNICHSKKNWARFDPKCMSVCMTCTGCCYHVLMKIDIPLQIFEEFSNIKHHDRRSSGTRVVLCGRADEQTNRYEEANTRTLLSCERAWREMLHGHSTRGRIVTRTAGRLYGSTSISGGSKRFISKPKRLMQPVRPAPSVQRPAVCWIMVAEVWSSSFKSIQFRGQDWVTFYLYSSRYPHGLVRCNFTLILKKLRFFTKITTYGFGKKLYYIYIHTNTFPSEFNGCSLTLQYDP